MEKQCVSLAVQRFGKLPLCCAFLKTWNQWGLTMVIVALSSMLACSNAKEQITTVNSKANGKQNLNGEKVSDFTAFFKRFYSDSAFQVQNIIFPFSFYYYEDDSEKKNLILKKDWGFITIEKDVATKTKILDHSRVRVDYYVPETCFYQLHYFELKDGKWNLVKIIDQSS